MEFLRKKNRATRLVFPLIDLNNRPAYFTGTVWGSLTNAAITAYKFSDGSSATTQTISGTPTELGTTGEWELALTQAECNNNYMMLKLNADEIDEQTLLIQFTQDDIKEFAAAGATAVESLQSSLHGSGSWEGGTTAPLVEEIDTYLSTTHGSGSWVGGTTAPLVEEIDTYMSGVHGAGSWESGGGAGVTAIDQYLSERHGYDYWGATGIDAQLTSAHGSGNWNKGLSLTDTITEANNLTVAQVLSLAGLHLGVETIPGSNPGTGFVILKDSSGSTLITLEYTTDANGNVTAKTVS
jgi:hypothetical protein